MGGSRSHSDFFFGKSSRNTSKPVQIFWSIKPYLFCLYTLLTVVGYETDDDLGDLSMLVMGLQKKILMGWVGGVSSIQCFLEFV